MKTVAIIGTGTMGPGMAATLARGGMDVRCFDTSEAARDRAPGDVEMAAGVLERIGGSAAASARVCHRPRRPRRSLGRCAISSSRPFPRTPRSKAQVFADLDRLSPPGAILASNTSGIPISKIQLSVSDPSRVVGMHWSNPPHVIPVIEVIAGEKTSPEVVEQLRAMIEAMGLMAVRVLRDVPGFVENRVLYAIMRECLSLVDNGVISAEELDTCVQVGNRLQAGRHPPAAAARRRRPRHLQRRGELPERGSRQSRRCERDDHVKDRRGQELGMKTGGGLFEYTGEEAASPPPAAGAAARRGAEEP